MKKTDHQKRQVEHFIHINTTICDNCGKENCDHGQILIGGSYIGGWYHLNRTPRATSLDELRRESSWDFCSVSCLKEFVEKLKD